MSINTNNASAGQIVVEFDISATAINTQKGVAEVKSRDTRTSDFYYESSFASSAIDLSGDLALHLYTLRDNTADVVTFEYVSAELFRQYVAVSCR